MLNDETPLTSDKSRAGEPSRQVQPAARRTAAGTQRVVDTQQQKRLDKTFHEDKQRILSNLASASACDHSPKGSVDAACVPLMLLLNGHPDYVTTSSCSGRISLFHSVGLSGTNQDSVKRGAAQAVGWVYVTHDPVTDDDAAAICDSMCAAAPPVVEAETEEQRQPPASKAHVGNAPVFTVPSSGGVLSLKCEPFVMHVQCRTMDAAKALLSAAVSDAGFRNSGITPPGARIMVAIRHAGLSLDCPLVMEGVNIVSSSASGRQYVRSLLALSNEKMSENSRRIQKLFDSVSKRIQSNEAAVNAT